MKKADKKIFATLFFSLFTMLIGVGIVIPLLPVYAHDLGASGFYVAMVFGIFSISRTCLLPYFGKRSDEKGRKPYIVTGLLAYGLVSIAFMFADTIEHLLTIRFVQGIASAMIMPTVHAYVGDITPKDREGFTTGVFNMSVFLGLSLGPLAGGVLKDHFSLQFSFLCMGILSFASFFLSLFLLPPRKSEQTVCNNDLHVGWKPLLRDRVIAGLFFFRFAYTACIGIIWSFLPVFADKDFSLSSSRIGLLVMLAVFVSGVVQTPMGFLADRVNKKAMLITGGLITGCSMFSFVWADGFGYLFLANIGVGLGGGISMAPHMAMAVQKGNQTEAMGSVMAIMTMAHSMGMMSGSLIAGVMMDIFELRQAFSFGSLLMMLGVILFFILTYPKKEYVQPVMNRR
ncbi:MFS transporter [Desulfonema magnum]|uniref:Major facilitator superfamily transporter n=1 Tax=Desulfonema magnum TaxID=45655 RepID=A0A975GVG2_9BACT|nr:MFS transporter [Desulfonema magnum]QTA93493.1 Major facilitator superfamily transporter [Desulfonema magnum]